MNFVERINYLANTVFESQSDLARKLDISKVTVNGYTTGKQKPNFDVLLKLHGLGFSIDWLISGKGAMRRQFFEDSNTDGYDKIVLEELYKDIAHKEFAIGLDRVFNEGKNKIGIIYDEKEKSLSVQRLIYHEYSTSALRTKIKYSVIFSVLETMLTRDSYRTQIIPLADDTSNLIDLLTNPDLMSQKKTINLQVRKSYLNNKLKYKEPPLETDELYQALIRCLFLLKELSEYESFIYDSIYNTQIDDVDDSSTKYEISFKSLKSYFRSQVELVDNFDLVDRKARILKYAVINNFKFVE